MITKNFFPARLIFSFSSILLIILFNACFNTLSAQDTEWTIQDVPFSNGEIFGIHYIDKNTGWAVGENTGDSENVLLRTTDGGDNWAYQAISFAAKKVFFVNANTGYIINSGGGSYDIKKTTDGGATWNSTNNPALNGVVLEDIYFRAENDGWIVGKYDSGQEQTSLLLRTTDGQNWSLPNYTSENGSLNAIYFTDTNNGWAVGYVYDGTTQTLVLHTSDGGSNWVKQATPSDTGELTGVFFIDQNTGWACSKAFFGGNDFILHTTNGGNNWTIINSSLDAFAYHIYFTSVSDGYLSSQGEAKLYKTTDGGVTWAEALSPVEDLWSSDIIFVEGSLWAWLVGAISKTMKPVIGTANLTGGGQKLASITVTPASVSLQAGEQQQFTAQGYDLDDNLMDPPITPMWSTDGGDITQAGMYTAPTTAGDYTVTCGNYGSTVAGTGKVRVNSGQGGGLITSVAPTAEAGTTTPPTATGIVGTQVPVEAKENLGWAFTHWVNAAPPEKRKAFAFLAAPPTEAVAHFTPLLTLSPGPLNPGYTTACPAEDENDSTRTPIIQIQLVASPADDWELHSVGFQVEGSLAAKHVRRVNLHLGSESGPQLASFEYGTNFSFPVPPPYNKLSAGSGRTFMITFDFEDKETLDQDNPVQFTVFTNRNFIGASAVEYPPGAILPTVPPMRTVLGGPIYLGCVHNVDTKLIFASIQKAIDAETTLDDHTIKVCPGTYNENVKVTKSILLKSIEGAEKTIIEAKTADDHVLHLSKKNTTIDGFTIEGASSDSVAGVYMKNGDFTNTKILENKITDNFYGIFLDYAQRAEMKGNTITENKCDGIHAIFSNGNKILENTITENDSNGIFMKNHLIEESVISKNEITANKSSGISLYKCKKILIKDNPKIENNGSSIYYNGSGIYGLYCEDSIKIINNTSIKSNNGSGILFKESKEFIIQMNYLVENDDGVFIQGCEKFLIGGNRNKLEGNTISGNSYGINLKGIDAKECFISGNCIGTNAEGEKEYNGRRQVHGIYSEDVSSITIGGNEEGQENVISGHENYGIYIIRGSKNKVIGNLIGTDIAGNDSIPNRIGIVLENSSSNTIGDETSEKQKNIISGNWDFGIEIREKSQFNKIWGNYIGTNKDGEKKLPNDNGISIIEGCNSNYIGIYEGTGKGNVISGNAFRGIFLDQCNDIHIKGNIIGLNKLGKKKLKNNWEGIYIEVASKCIIGGSHQSERNIISGNGRSGIFINNGVDIRHTDGNHKIRGNYIGTDISGKILIGNGTSGIKIIRSENNVIGGTIPNDRNVISGHKLAGIYILMETEGGRFFTPENFIWGNFIGTDVTGNTALGNNVGIELFGDVSETNIGGMGPGKGNIISGNITGISLVSSDYSFPISTKIIKNIIGAGKNLSINLGNDIGILARYPYLIEISKAKYFPVFNKYCRIESNLFYYNKTHYKGDKDKNLIMCNKFKNGTGTNTAISLDGSTSKVIGNIILDDAGNAIVCKNGDNPVISKNSIFNNNGFGLLNHDETVTINAQGNWWGDAGGPGGVGPGSGDEVSGNVDFSNWRTSPVALVVAAGADTVFLPVGAADSVTCYFQNWENLNDVINISVTDSLGWLQSPADFTLAFKDSMDAGTLIYLFVPASAQPGMSSKFRINAVSTYDPSVQDFDSFTVICYLSELERIVVSPDSIVIKPGSTVQFRAAGLDVKENEVVFEPIWSASSGVIDSTGLFTADSTEGTVTITVTDGASPVKGTAFIQVSDAALTLIRITVTPDSVTLNPGATKQFEAHGYDQFGMPINFSAQWSASGGTIDEYGTFTAGDETGTFTVTATDTSADLSGQAVLIIEHVSSVEEQAILPDNYCLHQNYPNPFNPETTIRFDVKERTPVVLKVYDLLGREVKVLVNSVHQPGSYKVNFDARDFATGVYFYRIQMKNFTDVKKMVLLE